jgi:hypothetical protein
MGALSSIITAAEGLTAALAARPACVLTLGQAAPVSGMPVSTGGRRSFFE